MGPRSLPSGWQLCHHPEQARVPDRIEAGCVAYASAVRALVDAGRYCELDAPGMRALTIRVLQSGDVAEGELATELAAGRLNHTLPVRTGLRDFVTGAWSLPEAWLAQWVRGRGLPAMAHNVTLSTLDGRRIGRRTDTFSRRRSQSRFTLVSSIPAWTTGGVTAGRKLSRRTGRTRRPGSCASE